MIFQSKGFYIDLVQNKDLKDIVEVYNSNKYFLINHMDMDIIKYEWIVEELESMKKADFYSCKVVEKSSGKIVGIIDFKIGEETYLSLLLIHNDYKNKGFGRLIYKALEEYITSVKSKCIRIDVVINYDDSVLKFWVKNGFSKIKDIELNWTGKILPAIIMKKFL
ncbi:GNAT family N-acetyltransferase [Clostridium tagluense]|uniref:GNAT family N-acetyltransferase n=1 Tax=Clostridium tagluense TaxID=360422 RepID=UPI001CF1F84F|nr:GNAT family N-acetyltransferase [Clostridium tagluense]MCB2312747.1 GNAT family N-acetyltransferase [Clostridium tagluense]MCB2317514.1 GNAT family N-acetyltransferase [Clostridium tagluense]MCB2322254.1 GNAT family N-acetyltransferase [Clostridium tagluense]MCB2327259.1 GNAT family N-acetyltransferase [Clostridium tagluense]MCB2332015.1 GNAT family N-acetyltransferase [Clostridium tagluense]